MSLTKKWLFAMSALLAFCSVNEHVAAQKLIPLPYVNKEWTQDYQPFRIAGNLYYVGSYDLGVYLVTTPQGHILINTGLANSDTMIRRHVTMLGFKFSDIKILLATHVHYDHAAALASIKKETGAKVMIHEKDAQALADGGNSDYVMGGKGSTFLPVKADKLLHDRDTIKLGGVNVVLLHHPGHTPGANSFLLDVKDEQRTYRVLIANMPSVLDETNLTGMPLYPNVGKDYAYTYKAMKTLQFDLWVASHASQFELQKKHPQGSAYNPMAFSDRAGYDNVLNELESKYVRKLKTDKK